MISSFDDTDDCRHRLEIVNREYPRCPDCGSPQLKVDRSISQGDDSRMKWVHCRACEYRFIEVWD
jgi:Zn finger protein HypA/HybF involved in hydrogenase expression